MVLILANIGSQHTVQFKVDVFIFVNGVPRNAKAGLDIQRVGNYRVVSSFNSPSGVWTLQKGQLKTKP